MQYSAVQGNSVQYVCVLQYSALTCSVNACSAVHVGLMPSPGLCLGVLVVSSVYKSNTGMNCVLCTVHCIIPVAALWLLPISGLLKKCLVFNVQFSMLKAQCSVFNILCLVFNHHCLVISAQFSVFSVQFLVFIVQCSVFSVQCALFSVQSSVFNGKCTFEYSLFSVKCSVLNI